MARDRRELYRIPRGTWPTSVDPGPAEQTERDPRGPDLAGQRTADDLYQAMGDLSAAIASLVPIVLSSETFLLDGAGQATREYHLPFRAIAVWSFSAAKLTLLNSTRQTSAPTSGPGVAIIPINGFKVSNLAGNAWSIYGGAPGDQVVVETYGIPMPPTAAKLV